MKLSRKGAEFIARFEGFVSTPYNDAAGHATIGYGHLIHRGNVTIKDHREWGHITVARALDLLQQDAEAAAEAVRAVRPPITSQTRFDALVSFVFNVGVGAFRVSTLRKRLEESGTARTGTGVEFLKWNKADGHVLAGLTRRRKAEKLLFELGIYH